MLSEYYKSCLCGILAADSETSEETSSSSNHAAAAAALTDV